MVVGTVTLGASLQLAVAALYAYLGRVVLVRSRSEGPRLWGAFAAFWIGVAVYGGVDGAWALASTLVPVPLAVAVVALQVKIVAAVVAFFGLVYYLLVVYTGTRRVFGPVLAAYFGILLLTTFFYAWRQPVGQHLGTWGATLDYANSSAAFQRVVFLTLFVPPGLAALAYAFLARVVHGPAQRARIVTVSASLFAFFASMTLGWLNGTIPWWGLFEKGLAFALALAVLASLRTELPPRTFRVTAPG